MGTSYEVLPIDWAAMDTTTWLDGVVRQFPRFHKYTLGTRIRDTSIEIVLLVARSNQFTERAASRPWNAAACSHLRSTT